MPGDEDGRADAGAEWQEMEQEALLAFFPHDDFGAGAVLSPDQPLSFDSLPAEPAPPGPTWLLPPPPDDPADVAALLGAEPATRRGDAVTDAEAGVRGRSSLVPQPVQENVEGQDPESQKHVDSLVRMLGSARQRSSDLSPRRQRGAPHAAALSHSPSLHVPEDENEPLVAEVRACIYAKGCRD